MFDNLTKVYDGFLKVFKVKITHKSFDGKRELTYEREIIDRKDAVVIVPWHKASNKIVLVNQFRVPVAFRHGNGYVLDAPAGVVENNDHLLTAYNELHEEAEITKDMIDKMHYLGSFYPSAGACSEKVHLYVAEINKLPTIEFAGLEEENEDIQVQIHDVKTIFNEIGKSFQAPTASVGIMKIMSGEI